MLKAEVFSTPQFKQSAAKDFIMVKKNADLDKGFASRYGVDGFPTVIFLNKSGKEVHRFSGYMPYSSVMGEVAAAKSKL